MIFRQWTYEIDRLKAALDHGQLPSAEGLAALLEMFEEGMASLSRERERLKAQEQEMALALSHTGDGVAVYCPTEGIRLANPAVEQLLGEIGPNLIGRKLEDFFDKRGQQAWLEIQNLLAAGESYHGMLQHLNSPEGPRSIVLSATMAHSPMEGKVHQVLTLRDVTEELAFEERLLGQKRFLENLVNLSDNAVGVFSPSGQWLMENLSLKTLIDDLGPEGRSQLTEILFKRFGSKHRLDGEKLTLTTKRGDEKVYFPQGQKIPANYLLENPDVKSVYVIYLSDLSELEAKKEELETKTRALNVHRLEKKWARRELANNLSFQLSQPLNVCKAIVNRLETAEAQDQQPGLVELNRRLVEMEATLKEAVRAEDLSGFAEGETSSKALAKGLAHLFAPGLAEAGIQFELENNQPELSFPMTSEVLLWMAGLLIDNATEALGESSGKLRVRLFSDTLGKHLAVEDSGPGIKDDMRLKVFEPLFSTKKGHEGLSLTMLFQILNQQNARIEIGHSTLGGAQVTLTFP